MENDITKSMPKLIVLADKAGNGARLHGVDLHLTHSTAALIVAERASLIELRRAFVSAKSALRSHRQTLETATAEGRAFVTMTREVLKPSLGKKYSEGWTGLGFQGSLRVPKRPDDLQPRLIAIHAWFARNTNKEVEDLDLTATRAQTLATSLASAIKTVITQKAEARRLLRERDAALRQSRKRLRGLVSELKLLMEPMDARWLAFGLNLPGKKKTPAPPESVEARSLAPSEVEVVISPTPRAEHYRVFTRVVGQGKEEFDVAAAPSGARVTLTGLISGSELEICATALNNGGESGRSAIVRVRVL
jgi:hypothetical protein